MTYHFNEGSYGKEVMVA